MRTPDLGDQLRIALDEQTDDVPLPNADGPTFPPFRDETVLSESAGYTVDGQHRRRLTRPLIVVALVLGLLGGGVGLAAASGAFDQTQSGLIPANPALHDHLELSKNRVQAGGPLTATLVIVNDSSKTINLSSPCTPMMDVILTDKSMPTSAIGMPHPGFCRRAPVLIPPGTTVRNLGAVPTTYLDCTSSPGQQVVQCLPNGQIPPLPPGRYYAVLTGDGLALPAPTPVPVNVTAG
jgi:hypothetical protein